MILSKRIPTFDFGSSKQGVFTSASLALLMAGSFSFSLQRFFINSFGFSAVSETSVSSSLFREWKLSDGKTDERQLEELAYQSAVLESESDSTPLLAPVALSRPVRLLRVKSFSPHPKLGLIKTKGLSVTHLGPIGEVESKSLTVAESLRTSQSGLTRGTLPLEVVAQDADVLTVYQNLRGQWGKILKADFNVKPMRLQNTQIATTDLDLVPEELNIHKAKAEWRNVAVRKDSKSFEDVVVTATDSRIIKEKKKPEPPADVKMEMSIQTLPTDHQEGTRLKSILTAAISEVIIAPTLSRSSGESDKLIEKSSASILKGPISQIESTPNTQKVSIQDIQAKVNKMDEQGKEVSEGISASRSSDYSLDIQSEHSSITQGVSISAESPNTLTTQPTQIGESVVRTHSGSFDQISSIQPTDQSTTIPTSKGSSIIVSTLEAGAGTPIPQIRASGNNSQKITVTIPTQLHIPNNLSSDSLKGPIVAQTAVAPVTPDFLAPPKDFSVPPNKKLVHGFLREDEKGKEQTFDSSDQEETSYSHCTTGSFGKRAFSKLPVFQSDLSVCKRTLSLEGDKDSGRTQWLEARVTEDVPGTYFPTITFQKWDSSDQVFNRIPMVSQDEIQMLELLTGIHVEKELGIVIGELNDQWSPEWVGRAERPLFLTEGFEQADLSRGDVAKYFVFLNVKIGSNLLSLKDRDGKSMGAIVPLVKSGTVTYIKLQRPNTKDVTVKVLDGSAATEIPQRQVTVEVVGQESKATLTRQDGTATIKDVVFHGDFPIYVDAIKTTQSFRHRFMVNLREVDAIIPLYHFDEELVSHWLSQVDQGISKDSGLVVGVRSQILKENPSSYMRLFKMEGAPQLREEFYGIARGEGLVSEPDMTSDVTRFLMIQVPEGMHILGDFTGVSNLKWSETIVSQPGVINVTRPH